MALSIIWTTLIFAYLCHLILKSRGRNHEMKINNPFIPPPPTQHQPTSQQLAAQQNAYQNMINQYQYQQATMMAGSGAASYAGSNVLVKSTGTHWQILGQTSSIPGEWRDMRPRTPQEVGEWVIHQIQELPGPMIFPQHVAKQTPLAGHVVRMLDLINEPWAYHETPDHYLVEVVDSLKKQTRI